MRSGPTGSASRPVNPNERLREYEKLEETEAEYGPAASGKDFGRKLRNAKVAGELEGEETDEKRDSTRQEIAKELPAPISLRHNESNFPIQPKPNDNGGSERNHESG